MRPLVRSAMRASAATERKERKEIVTATAARAKTQQPSSTTKTKGRNVGSKHDDAEESASIQTVDKHRDRPKEFATTSSAAPRRLNDVAMAPPELKRLKLQRPKAAANSGGKQQQQQQQQQHAVQTKVAGVLSMAQRAMMEVERENAIRRYRVMKERKSQGN